MTDETRNRVIGAFIVLLGIAEMRFVPDISAGIDMLMAFLAGACLGLGGGLLVTGRPFWESSRWWASEHPQKRR